MLIEVHAYKDRNTKHFVQGTRHCEDIRRTCGVVATVVSVRQAQRSCGSAGKKNVYHLVSADCSFDLFKAVLNSGLSEFFERDVPRVGASATIIEYQLLRRKVSPEENVPCGVIFINKMTWTQPPQGDAIPAMLNHCETPVPPVVEPDHSTFYFDSDYVDWVHEHSAFSLSQKNRTMIGIKSLCFHESMIGKALQQYEQDISDRENCGTRSPVNKKHKAIIEEEQTSDEEEEEEVECVCCDCERNYGYSLCVRYSFPLKKVDIHDLFDQVEARLGNHNLTAPTWEEFSCHQARRDGLFTGGALLISFTCAVRRRNYLPALLRWCVRHTQTSMELTLAFALALSSFKRSRVK